MVNVLINLEDITITTNAIRTFFIILCTCYTFFKITNIKLNLDIKTLMLLISMSVIAVVLTIIEYHFDFFLYLVCMIFLLSCNCSIFTKGKLGHTVIGVIISIAINYIVFVIALFFNFIINLVVTIIDDRINLIVIMIFHIIILLRLCKIKRIKNGITFLSKDNKDEYIDMIILSIGTIIVFSVIILANFSFLISEDFFICFIILAIIMFITIQKSLQLYYKQKLLVQELNETKSELEKKTKEVEELEKENLSFSKKSHTLAHKQKSLEYKLQEMMLKTEISKEEVAEVIDRLKEIKKDLYKEKTTMELDKTGISQIDDMLKYMQSECVKNKIDFELQLNGNIHYMTNNLISKEDLETLLADHIKNAIIAINHTDNINRSILVRLGKIDETYGLYIYDSGVEFEKETLENLGKKPSTTHADEGGTGMGFMNTFDTLRKCNASLMIEEYNEPSKDNYTKAIMIKFDNKNEFKIKSYCEDKVSIK